MLKNKTTQLCFFLMLASYLAIYCLAKTNLMKNPNKKETNIKSENKKSLIEKNSEILPSNNKEENEKNNIKTDANQKISTNLKQESKKINENKTKKTFNYRCGHGLFKNKMIPNRMYSDVSKEKFAKMYSNAEWNQIRIHIDFTKLESQRSEMGNEKVDALKKIMQRSQKILQKIVKVKPLTKKLILENEGKDLPFSDFIKNNGVDADLLLTVEFSSGVTGSTVATANAVEYEEKSGRPIVGRLQYNKSFSNKKNAITNGIPTALHEITHVLVFNNDFYDKFINPNTLEKIPKENVIKDITVNGQPRKMIITPNVVKYARKHFNCNSLQGVEVENQGGDGTAFGHWEERLMLGDLMIGEDGAENVFSEITLGLFDDSGWYKTNKFTGGLFVFGINQGCAFIEEKCANEGVTKFKNDFCVTDSDSNCDSSHRQRTICALKTYDKDLPENYKYFSNPKLGGVMPLSDFCPIPVKNSDDNDDLRNSCNYGQKSTIKEVADLEVIGENSACFVSNVLNTSSGNSYSFSEGKGFTSACYQYKCNDSEKIVEIVISGTQFKCPREGGLIEINHGHAKGSLYCMEYNLICNQTAKCNDIYECAMKESKRKNDLKFDYTSKTIGSGSNL